MAEDFSKYPNNRKAALEAGSKFYFTGLSCRNGHIDKRYARGVCVSCRVMYGLGKHVRRGDRTDLSSLTESQFATLTAFAPSLQKAITWREPYYFTGRPCPKGHVTFRRVIDSECDACRKERSRQKYDRMSPEVKTKRSKRFQESARIARTKDPIQYSIRKIVSHAAQRAKEQGVPFALDYEYLKTIWPDDGMCPIMLIRMKPNTGHARQDSPTLDKMLPHLGYVPGNVMFMSNAANTIKSNCLDPEVFRRLANLVERQQRSHWKALARENTIL